MILSDTLGCKYTLPPIDTIYVYDYPKAEIVADGLCYHQPIKVSNASYSKHEDPTLKSSWFFNGSMTSPGKDSMYMPEKRGNQSILLIVENKGTCKDTAEKTIRIFAPISDFSISDKHTCLGMPLSIINATNSDTGIIAYEWDLGDGTKHQGKDVLHQYNKAGTYTVSLITRDAMQCEDTVVKPNIAVIGDTISPLPVPIRRASVLNDYKTELVFSKYPDFDFTSYSIYKSDNRGFVKIAEVSRAEDTVFTDNQVNTLHQSYCYKIRTKNLCLLSSDLLISAPHCTVETEADGILEANQVSWSAYVGFDSIARYEIWRAEGDRNNVYSLIDSVDGDVLAYTDTHFTCYTSKYYRIKAIQKGGFKEYSNSDTARAKPYYVNTTTANYAWRATVENNDYVRLEWLNNAWSKHGIKGYVVDKYFADGNRMFQNKYFDATDTILDDRQVKVNEKSYYYLMRGVDNCNDTTPWSNLSQTILLKGYFDETTQKPAVRWNGYRDWDQGIAYYEVERKQADGSFKFIGKVAKDQHQFVDQQAESSCVPDYIYRVRAVSNWHAAFDTLALSYSNEVKVLPRSTLFVPNAFSPDRNDINEVFGGKGQYISRYHIEIFNRWGEKVFDSNECLAGWNGEYKGERCMQDVYMYQIEALGADNKTYLLRGTFTLLR
jgi:gliding motility-associated-like protein